MWVRSILLSVFSHTYLHTERHTHTPGVHTLPYTSEILPTDFSASCLSASTVLPGTSHPSCGCTKIQPITALLRAAGFLLRCHCRTAQYTHPYLRVPGLPGGRTLSRGPRVSRLRTQPRDVFQAGPPLIPAPAPPEATAAPKSRLQRTSRLSPAAPAETQSPCHLDLRLLTLPTGRLSISAL